VVIVVVMVMRDAAVRVRMAVLMGVSDVDMRGPAHVEQHRGQRVERHDERQDQRGKNAH
jgi:hypothetical protein